MASYVQLCFGEQIVTKSDVGESDRMDVTGKSFFRDSEPLEPMLETQSRVVAWS